jgi:uncharacterized protein (TIGR03086 family)
MEPTEALHRALTEITRISDGIVRDDLAHSTPCEDFDVKALLNHTVASMQGLAEAASGRPWDMSAYGRDVLDDDPKEAVRSAAAALRDATSAADILERPWAMPGGDRPGAQAIAIGIMEVAQHGWDLARATGQQPALDPAVSELALELARQNLPPDDERPPAAFARSVPVGDDAPAHDRLAAFMGRQP